MNKAGNREEWEGWKEFFSAQYPKRVKGMMIHPEYATSQKIFRFYGQNASGTWLLSYTGILDGLYVSTDSRRKDHDGRRGCRNVVVKNCVFDQNTTEQNGGGIYIYKSLSSIYASGKKSGIIR